MSFSIAYKIIGKGDPIIFIHGIGSSKHSWEGVIKELKNSYKCINYDLRGHGESIFDNSDYKLDKLVDDLEDLRSHLNIKKTHLVGHSLGGMIGPAYVRKFPHRVFSVSLLSTSAFRKDSDRKKIIAIIEKIKNEGIEKVIQILINRWFTDDFIKNNQEIINKRIEQLFKTNLETFLNVFRIYALTEMSPWLHEIKVPCLVMTGENDDGCNPHYNKKISNAIPDSKLKILKNLKHAITLEAPNTVGKALKDFLNQLVY